MAGLKILYNLILKDAARGSGQASGILSIGKDIRKLADKKLQRYITAAQKQGVDLDKLSEQEIKYMLELNKPKGPTIGGHQIIDASSPEGQGITRDLFNMLDRQSGKNVIKTDFGKPFAEEVVTVESVVTDIKKMKPMDSMKEANKVLKGEGRYKSLSKADREKIASDESVTDHIFERNIEPDPEDMADGGVAGMLDERIGFKLGGINKARRLFLQAMGAGAAGIGAAKTGLFGLLKSSKPVTKELNSVPIKNIEGMPAWFKPLVNKVIKEGTEVSSGAERVIVHRTKLPNSKTDVHVIQELDTGHIMVDIGKGKHGFADGHLGQPVSLEYRASELIEPTINTKTGKVIHKGQKTKPEFNVEEAEFTGGHPENIKFEESTINKFGEHGSNFDEVEMFATGKVKKSKPTKKAERTEWESGKAEADAEAAADMADDFASGGLARMLGE